jgi:hypothetical protein
MSGARWPLLALLALLLTTSLATAAHAETAVLLPPTGDDSLKEQQQEALRVLSRTLTSQGIRLLSREEAVEQAGAADVSDCRSVDCAPKLLRACGADVAAAIAVWSAGAERHQAVFVTLVDRQGDRYPGKANVDGDNLGIAAKDALIDARALQLLGPGPWLRVRTKPDGAQVLLGGKLVGATPYRAHVQSGRHVLEVRAEGRESHVQTVDIPPNSARQVEVEVALQPSHNTADSPDDTATALDTDSSEPPIDHSPPIIGPVILGVVGVGLLATDIALVASSGCKRHDTTGKCTKRAEVDTPLTVVWGATGVAAIAGGVLWYVLGSASDDPPPVAVSIGPHEVRLSGSF